MNMQTKHTPGPWVVRNMSDAMATVERLSNDGLRSVICRINDMEVCPEHGGTGSDANAHLIAAAPAMYLELQNIVEGLTDEITRIIEGNKPDTARLDYLANKAGQAVAQAEGRTL